MTPAAGTLAHHLLTMAYQNAWANHRLLKACAKLTDEDFCAARTSFFPSLVATLNHNLTVDWFYVDALERELRGEPPHPDCAIFFRPEQPFAQCGPLWLAQAEVDKRLIAYCRAQPGDAALQQVLTIERPRHTQRDTRARLLSHLFEHQLHHRGQAHAMLAGTSVKPPQLDEFFCQGEAHLRAQDFAELGFSEALIWGEGEG